MKKHLLITPALCVAALSVQAQFVTSGGNTTTNDNVGIGTSTPAFKLDVAGTTLANRTIGINGFPMLYYPDQSSILGSFAVGNGLRMAGPYGSISTTVGIDAGLSVTSGWGNNAFGYKALMSTSAGHGNAAFGTYALMDNVNGVGNAAFGSATLQHNTGAQNSGFGQGALFSNTSGVCNTASGWYAGFYNTTGRFNVAVGTQSLYNNATGDYNMALGTYADVLSNNLSNATAIGANAKVGRSNAIVLGDSTKPTNVGIGTSYPDYALDVRATANPVRLRGLQAGDAVNDYIVTASANGVLRRVPASSFGGGSVTGAGNGVTLDGSIVALGDECGKGGGKFEKEREINMNDYDLYFNSAHKGKIFMGISDCQPLMTRLEISVKGLTAVNDYDMTLPSSSGLRFKDLKATNAPITNQYDGVLSLDEDGDVIWVKACCEAGKQSADYEELKNTVAELKAELEMLKSVLNQGRTGTATGLQDQLFQNVPNPSGAVTRIDYALAERSSDASIVVYDLSGRVMTRIALEGAAGRASVNVDMSSWAAGTYSYALFVNGQIRDTRKMQVAH